MEAGHIVRVWKDYEAQVRYIFNISLVAIAKLRQLKRNRDAVVI